MFVYSKFEVHMNIERWSIMYFVCLRGNINEMSGGAQMTL